MWAVVNIGEWGAIFAAKFAQMIVNFMHCFMGINAFCNPALIRDENKDIASFCENSECLERCRKHREFCNTPCVVSRIMVDDTISI